jgi:hypothetical protein
MLVSRTAGATLILAATFVLTGLADAQLPEHKRSPLSEVGLGALKVRTAVPISRAQRKCLALPPIPGSEDAVGPDRISKFGRCEVIEFHRFAKVPSWGIARYRRTSSSSADDPSQRSSSTGVTSEEEVVLFDMATARKVKPVWHDLFATGPDAIWRSVTLEVAPAGTGATLVSVMYCLNGTGGCGQEFLGLNPDRTLTGIRQDWLDQLPPGFLGRISHGSRIDPTSLRGEAGFYGDRDPNCCPSEVLSVELALRGDALVLLRHSVKASPGG